ncbi:MAG TPA: hypothetical protein VGC56_10410 [Allosphingosinicella sp.]|jgi:hypothetical protein
MMLDGAAVAGEEVEEEYVLETDQAPEFWQFLAGLQGDDPLVELIVNDLDAKSPRTEIRFEPEGMICTGAGDPIDGDGWARLRKLKGAGHEVKAKVGLFGVKNHGLKACFTLGDSILVRSAGKQILQTLFRNGPAKPAFPGVRVPPRPDPVAPPTGTQIQVRYRRRAFVAPHGESLRFAAADDHAVRAIYEEAVRSLPKRLLGIVQPGVLEQYTLALSHHELGCRTFTFSCGRPRREGRLVTFFRECRELGPVGDSLVEREQAVLSVWSPAGFETKPRFFQSASFAVGGKRLFAKDGIVLEVAWGTDRQGRLRNETGRLRYPVSYPEQAAEARTGMGFHYSGPFVSDTERYDLAAQSQAWNGKVVEACDGLAAACLTGFLLKRRSAAALELFAHVAQSERLTKFVVQALATRTLPAVDGSGKPVLVKRGAQLVVPAHVGQASTWSRKLAAVAPPGSAILHPDPPSPIVALLAGGKCPGWSENHLTFDEFDVIDRLKSREAQHFPWRSDAEWRSTLGGAVSARAHLEAVEPVLRV